jgi:hypothetical protein
MKPAALLLNVLLVAAGLFVYDSLKKDAEPAGPRDVPEYITRTEPEREPAREPDPPALRLEGLDPSAQLARLSGQISELLSRVNRLEAENRTLRASVGSGRPVGEPSNGSGPVWDVDGNPDADIDPAMLARFRDYMDAVERQKRDERFEEMIQGQFDRIGVNLPDEQRMRAVKATVVFRERVRETLQQQVGGSDESRRERLEAMEALRQDYAREINQIAPPSEAQKIIDGMGRYPGMSARPDAFGQE